MTSFCGHTVAQINAPLRYCVNRKTEECLRRELCGNSSLHVLKICIVSVHKQRRDLCCCFLLGLVILNPFGHIFFSHGSVIS